MKTGTGGGYGNPLVRPSTQVTQDVKNGCYTAQVALETYGARVDPESFDFEELAARKEKNENRKS